MAIKFGRPIEMRDTPRRETALSASSLDLVVRPRRNRKAEWSRRLVRENVLTTDDLIWPMFVTEGQDKRTPVASMPGVDRISVDQAVREAERAVNFPSPASRCSPTPSRAARRAGRRGRQPRQSRVPRGARRQARRGPASACSATWRSIPSPATATTG